MSFSELLELLWSSSLLISPFVVFVFARAGDTFMAGFALLAFVGWALGKVHLENRKIDCEC